MNQSKNIILRFLQKMKRFSIKIRRWSLIILAASMIGFSNAFNDETRMLNNIRNWIQQEQVVDDEDENE